MPNYLPDPPNELTVAGYRLASGIEDVDSAMWGYLCDLIAEDQRPFRARVAEMLRSISPELQRYYLVRGFDWERGSGGLESCLMNKPEDDHHFLAETIEAYEALGASKHAAIIRELMPKAAERWRRIEDADARGEEFNYDDNFWDPYEIRWDAASEEFNYPEVIWNDIQAHPERYSHPRR